MNSLGYTVWGFTLLAAAVCLALIYFTTQSYIRIWHSRGLHDRHKRLLINMSLLLLLAGTIMSLHFLIVGGPNTGEALAGANGYLEIQIGLASLVIGVVLARLALPHPTREVDKTKWHWPRRHKFYSLIILIIIGAVGVVIYQTVALRVNRAEFKNARSAIDTVYADIVQKVGQPDNSRKTNICSLAYQEWAPSTISCSVGTDFIYGVTDEDAANAKMKQIQDVISQHNDLFKPTKAISNSIQDTYIINTLYHSAGDEYTNDHTKCRVNYVYSTPRDIDLLTKSKDKKAFEIYFECFGEARGQYYQLENPTNQIQ